MELSRNHERRIQYALQIFFTEKLLGLQGLNITNIEVDEKTIIIHAKKERKEHICKKCKTATNMIHDYRTQVIKDIPAFGKLVNVVLRKRRYRCPCCGKRFFEENVFLPKYQCILTDPVNKVVLDILPERYGHYLNNYFKNIPQKERQQVDVMLYYSSNISRAYWYKEEFLKILTHKKPELARKALAEWVKNAEHCGILPFEKCADTIRNRYTGISNSFSTSITNGFTEGYNNKIKFLKRNAYGYKNFNRFRNRILHIFSHQQSNNEQAAA